MINQAVMVMSGYNMRAVVAFCRWGSKNNINFHIIAKDKKDPIFLTAYKNHVSFVRDSTKLHHEIFRLWIDSLCHQYAYERIIILPSTEYLNRFLLKNRNSIESKNCIIPLVNESLYRKISDKHSFTKLCQSYGLDIPKEFDEMPDQVPFVAKPRSYSSGKGHQLTPCLIENSQDLEYFCKNCNKSDYFFQQFVYGKSLYLLAYIGKSESEDNIIFSQENLMQQSGGGSIILAKHSRFHQGRTAKRYVAMLQEQNFSGLIMIEVRAGKSNESHYMIEANPRLWGPIQFCVDNNIDLFGAMFREYGFEIPEASSSYRSSTHYFWSGGITEKAQPITLHGYTNDKFAENFQQLRSLDIFARKDTLDLYLDELGVNEEK